MQEQEVPWDKFTRRQILKVGAAALVCKGIYSLFPDPPPPLDFGIFSEERNAELNSRFTIENPESGQRLDALFLNQNKMREGVEPIITTTTYSRSLEDEQTRYNFALIAEQTNRPVLAYDRYGTGRSDDLTQEQIDSLVEGEGLLLTVKSITQSLQRFKIPGRKTPVEVKKAYIAGNSMGASIGSVFLAATTGTGIHISKAVLVEPVGVANFSWEELAYKFLSGGFREERELSPAMKGFLDIIDLMIEPSNDSKLYYARALTQDFVPKSLTKALTTNDKLTILVGYGTESDLCPEKNIQEMIDDLNLRFGGRVTDYPFEGYGHEIFGVAPSWSHFLQKQLG